MTLPPLPAPNGLVFLGAADAEPVWNESQVRDYAWEFAAFVAKAAVQAEREACAKVCDGIPGLNDEEAYWGGLMAAAIRARKE